MSDILPLPYISQGGAEADVLLYNAEAPSVDLYECAASRLEAVRDLLDSLSYPVTLAGGDGAAPAHSVARVSSLLLSDVCGLMATLHEALLTADSKRRHEREV